jgi:hypothetical protein
MKAQHAEQMQIHHQVVIKPIKPATFAAGLIADS